MFLKSDANHFTMKYTRDKFVLATFWYFKVLARWWTLLSRLGWTSLENSVEQSARCAYPGQCLLKGLSVGTHLYAKKQLWIVHGTVIDEDSQLGIRLPSIIHVILCRAGSEYVREIITPPPAAGPTSVLISQKSITGLPTSKVNVSGDLLVPHPRGVILKRWRATARLRNVAGLVPVKSKEQ